MTRYYHILSCILLSLIFCAYPAIAQEKNKSSAKASKKTHSKSKKALKKPIKVEGIANGTALKSVGESFVISDIKVEGQRKIEKDSILNRLKLKKAQSYSQADFRSVIREDIGILFKTGFFSNVEVNLETVADQKVVVFKVQEKPSVSEITWEGVTEDVKKEEVQEAQCLPE